MSTHPALSNRLPKAQRWSTYATLIAVALSGIAWWLLHDVLRSGWTLAERRLLISHGVAAAAALVVVGALLPLHVRLAWRIRRNLRFGHRCSADHDRACRDRAASVLRCRAMARLGTLGAHRDGPRRRARRPRSRVARAPQARALNRTRHAGRAHAVHAAGGRLGRKLLPRVEVSRRERDARRPAAGLRCSSRRSARRCASRPTRPP